MSTGPRNKQRAYEHETEIVKAAEAEGMSARRAWGSDGRALGLAADVDVEIDGRVRVQAKRRKRLPAYLQVPVSCDAVVFRQDRGEQLVLVRWADWVRMVSKP